MILATSNNYVASLGYQCTFGLWGGGSLLFQVQAQNTGVTFWDFSSATPFMTTDGAGNVTFRNPIAAPNVLPARLCSANNTTTAAFNSIGADETQYCTTAQTTLALTLPASGKPGQLLRYLNTTSSACGTSSTTYPGATPVGYQLTYALQPGSSLEFYWDATAAKWVGMQIYAAYNNH